LVLRFISNSCNRIEYRLYLQHYRNLCEWKDLQYRGRCPSRNNLIVHAIPLSPSLRNSALAVSAGHINNFVTIPSYHYQVFMHKLQDINIHHYTPMAVFFAPTTSIRPRSQALSYSSSHVHSVTFGLSNWRVESLRP